MVHASPQAYRDGLHNTQLDGTVVQQMRDQFIGESRGLSELSRLLARREQELRERIKQQENNK